MGWWSDRCNLQIFTNAYPQFLLSNIACEICISVMLANSGNRSARRHGYSIQHSPPVPICFTILPVLSITWPWNDLQECLCIPIPSSLSVNGGHEKSGGKEFKRFTSVSTWKRADKPVASSQPHVRLSFWALPKVSCTEYTHIHAVSTCTQSWWWTHRIVCCCHPATWLAPA